MLIMGYSILELKLDWYHSLTMSLFFVVSIRRIATVVQEITKQIITVIYCIVMWFLFHFMGEIWCYYCPWHRWTTKVTYSYSFFMSLSFLLAVAVVLFWVTEVIIWILGYRHCFFTLFFSCHGFAVFLFINTNIIEQKLP